MRFVTLVHRVQPANDVLTVSNNNIFSLNTKTGLVRRYIFLVLPDGNLKLKRCRRIVVKPENRGTRNAVAPSSAERYTGGWFFQMKCTRKDA